MTRKIIIHNHINEKIKEYKEKTGATTTWICKQMGISKQSLYVFKKQNNFNLDSLIKISIVLGCEVSDLYSYEIIDEK